MKRKIVVLCFTLLACLPLFAQRQALKNIPYIDQRRVHYGFLLGIDMADATFSHSGANSWTAECPTINPAFCVGLMGDIALTENLNVRCTPSLHFMSRDVKFRDYVTGETRNQTLKSNFVGREYQVVAIGDSVFLGDTLLETVYLPEGIRQLGAQAFKYCRSLKMVNLPNSVTQLGSGCFQGCWDLHNLHLSDKLTELPSRCFVDNSLETVLIPEGVTTLHEDVFVNCSKLHDVSLPTSLSAIGRGVFYMCSSLEEITLPAQVASVGEYCFYYCDKLRDIYCLATTPPQAIATFDRQDIRLHVPPTSIEAYRNHSVWGKLNVMGE